MLSRRSFLAASSGMFMSSLLARVDLKPVPYPLNLDHLIVGCRDLDQGIAYIEKFSGYRAELGGSHPGRGTRNALLNLGHQCYLEILAPDPAQPQLAWHKEILLLTEPELIGFALRQKDLDKFAQLLREHGVECTGPTPGSRTRPDGQTYRWQTLVLADDRHGNLPFFIDWAADSPHPASDAPGGCLLTEFVSVPPFLPLPPPPGATKTKTNDAVTSQKHAKIVGKNGVFALTTRPVSVESWVMP